MNAHTRPPIRIQVIIGNIRDGRAADAVSRWTLARANALSDVLVETLDLREWLLPHFAETSASLGDPADPSYSTSVVQDWNDTIACADAYVFITPEYNHGIPGVLKNALDSVFASFAFRNKPAMFVAYSAGPPLGQGRSNSWPSWRSRPNSSRCATASRSGRSGRPSTACPSP
jgi:NAD(P)H-dependent FMN reductase